MSVKTEESVEALSRLGFTGLEAEVYAYLLTELPSTGYRVAQALNRPVANVYKALEALESKGAVVVDPSETKLSRAVPADELLKRLERDFSQRAARARNALDSLKPAPGDSRVYQLRTRDQVLERCRAMIRRADSLVIADLFPDPLQALRADLEAAAARGITVIAKAFEPSEMEGVTIIQNPGGPELVERYPGQWLILTIDGAELVIASLAKDRRTVHQAIWTESPTISWIVHTSFAAEMMFCELANQIVKTDDLESLKRAIGPYVEPGARFANEPASEVEDHLKVLGRCFSQGLAGYQALLRQFGSAGHDVIEGLNAVHGPEPE
jgi:sugar-specific transcriptional regulator TrmB